VGEETGIRPKTISCAHGDEEAIAWSITWAKKEESVLKQFPVPMEMKKP